MVILFDMSFPYFNSDIKGYYYHSFLSTADIDLECIL